MGTRSQRYSMIVNDGVLEQLNVEAPGEFKVSSPSTCSNSFDRRAPAKQNCRDAGTLGELPAFRSPCMLLRHYRRFDEDQSQDRARPRQHPTEVNTDAQSPLSDAGSAARKRAFLERDQKKPSRCSNRAQEEDQRRDRNATVGARQGQSQVAAAGIAAGAAARSAGAAYAANKLRSGDQTKPATAARSRR
jgi:hypothetical protein